MRFTLYLPHHVDSIPSARHALDRLDGELDDLTMRNARLLVSELVTNVIRHVAPAEGDDQVALTIELSAESLRVRVADKGRGFQPAPRIDAQDVASGWGLHILAQLASRWGVESDGGTSVWFELPRAATGRPARSASPAGAA